MGKKWRGERGEGREGEGKSAYKVEKNRGKGQRESVSGQLCPDLS